MFYICKQCRVLFAPQNKRGRPSAFCGKRCQNRYFYAQRVQLGLLTCATCSRPMQASRTSRPQGLARCLPCRRATHGLRPDESVNEAKRSGRIPCAKKRGDCHRCGSPVPSGTKRWKYCTDECFRKARNARGSGRPGTSRRGYGTAHQKLRAELLPLAYGARCHFCGDLMQEGDDLHLDHTEDRSGYRGITHSACNIADGSRRGGQAMRKQRLREGWRPGQDPGTRRRSKVDAA